MDHPSFGGAVIGRLLESLGLNVAIVPQPNWQDDLRDFKKLGKPNLFFGISPGCMDSMVNHYTAAKSAVLMMLTRPEIEVAHVPICQPLFTARY